MTAFQSDSYSYLICSNENNALTTRPISNNTVNQNSVTDDSIMLGSYDYANSYSNDGGYGNSNEKTLYNNGQMVQQSVNMYSNDGYNYYNPDRRTQESYSADTIGPSVSDSTYNTYVYHNYGNNAMSSNSMFQAQPSVSVDGMYANKSSDGGCGKLAKNGSSKQCVGSNPMPLFPLEANTLGVVTPSKFSTCNSTDLKKYQMNGYQDSRMNSCYAFTSKPVRTLPPQPQSNSQMRSRGFSQDNFINNSYLKAANIGSNRTPINYYDSSATKENNAISNNFNVYDTSVINYGSAASAEDTYDQFYPMQTRPYTAMGQFEFDDDFNEDNYSTCSDTPLALSKTQSMSNATLKQKIQQQRKLSLMMAMTTASVIASGETRIPPQKQKKRKETAQPKFSDLSTINTNSNSICAYNAPSLLSNNLITSNGNFQSKNLIDAANTATYLTFDNKMPVPSSSSSSTTDISNTLNVMGRQTRSRKLPKRLPPTPTSKKKLPTDVTRTDIKYIDSCKQLDQQFVCDESNVTNTTVEIGFTYTSPSSTSATEHNIINDLTSSRIPSLDLPVSNTYMSSYPATSNAGTDPSEKTSLTKRETTCDSTNIERVTSENFTTLFSLNLESNNIEPSICGSIDFTNNNHKINDNIASSDLNKLLKTIPSSTSSIKSSSIYTRPITSMSTPTSSLETPYFSTSSISATPEIANERKSEFASESYLDIKDYLKSYELPKLENELNNCTTKKDSSIAPDGEAKTDSLVLAKNKEFQSVFENDSSYSFLSLNHEIRKETEPVSTTSTNSQLSIPMISTDLDTEAKTAITTVTTLSSEINLNYDNIPNFDFSDYKTDFGEVQEVNNQDLKDSNLSSSVKEVVEKYPSCTLITAPTASTYITTTTSCSPEYSNSYEDYMKKFKIPEIPPILTEIPGSELCADPSNILKDVTEQETTIQPFNENFTISILDQIKLKPLNDETKKDAEISEEKDFLTSVVSESTDETQLTTTISTPPLLNKSLVNFPPNTEENSNDYFKRDKDFNEVVVSKEWNADDNFLSNVGKTINSSQDISFHQLDNNASIPTSLQTEDMRMGTTADSAKESVSSTFDDSFYDAYKVDVDTLSALVTKASESTTTNNFCTSANLHSKSNQITNNYSSDPYIEMNSFEGSATSATLNSTGEKQMNSSSSQGSIHGGYYKPSSATKLVTTNVETTVPVQESTSTPAMKATNILPSGAGKVFGGLLDGVLSGVSAAVSSQHLEEQQSQKQPPASKKGFSFGLGSKLVPSVGNFLSAPTIGSKTASAMKTTEEFTQAMAAETENQHSTPFESNFFAEESNTTFESNTSNLADRFDYGNNELSSEDSHLINNKTICDDVYFENGLSDGVVYNREQGNNCDNSKNYFDEYDVGDYSEFNNVNSANIYAVEASHPPSAMTNVDDLEELSSFGDQKRSTSSVFSILATGGNASTTQKKPTQSVNVPPQKSSTTGTMFGSLLGKAAAAVQSATQVVNQGAAVIAQHQKSVIPTIPITTSTPFTKPTTTAIAAMVSSPPVVMNTAYNSQESQNSLLGSRQYSSDILATACDDYTNSNTVSSYVDAQLDSQNSVNYYSNGNQNQPPIVTIPKILPVVPSVGGSTGKKLPTIINGGKSGIGFLMKQQPTEIYDDEETVDDYHLDDNEQNDYFIDPKQSTSMAPPVRNYYEQHHSGNGGYDYREDFFDEEDEYKYLENEAKNDEQLQFYNRHQGSHPNEDMSDGVYYVDDNYPSEDSGNYLDESSSGSVGISATKKSEDDISNKESMQMGSTNKHHLTNEKSTTMSSIISHQQIKKQDSIIMEDDDEIIPGNNEDTISFTPTENITASKRELCRRKSSDAIIDTDIEAIDHEDDQLNELPTAALERKKKVLIRGETEEVVSGNMQMMLRPKATQVSAKQRWLWAYNKIIMQLNVSTIC